MHKDRLFRDSKDEFNCRLPSPAKISIKNWSKQNVQCNPTKLTNETTTSKYKPS